MCLKLISTRDQMKKTYAPKAGSEVVALIVGEIGIMSRPDSKDRHVATAACPWLSPSYPKLTQELARHLVP